MRVQIKILFFSLLFYGLVLPQSEVRIVDARSLKPIGDVVISAESKITISNEAGYFSLQKFNVGDTLLLQHLLYQKLKLAYNQIVINKIIKFHRKKITTKLIKVVVENKNSETNAKRETVKLDKQKIAQYSGLSELLKKNTTLFVKDYGGYSGLKTVSARGMGSENTVVLFNEARVNDLRTGTFNFAEVDSKFINKIVYAKNSETNIQSSGGVVKLFSENEEGESSFTFGGMINSTKTKNYFASLKKSSNNISYSLNFNRINSPNKYHYVFDGKQLQRENADFSKSFLSGSLQWISKNFIIKLYTHYSHLLNGLPGFVVTNNFNYSKASNLTNSLLSIVNINYSLGNNILFSSNIGFHKQYLKLIDPLNQLLIDRHSQSSTFNDLGITNKLQYNLGNVSTTLIYYFNYGQVDSLAAVISGKQIANFTKRNEHQISFTANSNYKFRGVHNLILSGGIDYQIFNDNFIIRKKNNYFSYQIGLELVPDFWQSSNITFSFADNYRHPSFNEVYYSSLFGNNNLQEEKYKNINAGFNFNLSLFANSEIHLTYFSIWGNDKIIWIPTRIALQVPRNIKKIKSEGIEVIINQSIITKMIKAEFIYSFVDARNLSFPSSTDFSYNKQLIYTPKNRWNFNTYFNYKRFNLTINASFVGESFYTSDNSQQNKLKQYFLLDASTGYSFDLFGAKHTLTLNAYNIFNVNYFVIQSYPMPLNSFSINYQVRF